MGRARELAGASFIRALIPCMTAPPSRPNHLPKALLPNIITLRVRISTNEFWKTGNIQPVAYQKIHMISKLGGMRTITEMYCKGDVFCVKGHGLDWNEGYFTLHFRQACITQNSMRKREKEVILPPTLELGNVAYPDLEQVSMKSEHLRNLQLAFWQCYL